MTVEDVPHHADRDHFILLAGTNLDDLSQYGAEVHLQLGPETTERVITEPKMVYVPRSLT